MDLAKLKKYDANEGSTDAEGEEEERAPRLVKIEKKPDSAESGWQWPPKGVNEEKVNTNLAKDKGQVEKDMGQVQKDRGKVSAAKGKLAKDRSVNPDAGRGKVVHDMGQVANDRGQVAKDKGKMANDKAEVKKKKAGGKEDLGWKEEKHEGEKKTADRKDEDPYVIYKSGEDSNMEGKKLTSTTLENGLMGKMSPEPVLKKKAFSEGKPEESKESPKPAGIAKKKNQPKTNKLYEGTLPADPPEQPVNASPGHFRSMASIGHNTHVFDHTALEAQMMDVAAHCVEMQSAGMCKL